MIEVLAILGFAALFVVFGSLRGRIQQSHHCDICPDRDDPGACEICHTLSDISESNHA
jgi:hypothetical protein